MSKYLYIILLLSFPTESKPKCEKELQQLKKVQQKLRQGYSAKQGEKLKQKEKQLRRKWWLCKKGSVLKSNKSQ